MTFETLARALETDSNADDDINREFLATKHAADIAQFLDEHDADTDWRVLNLLDIGRQAEILGYLDRKQQVALARSAPRARLAAVVSEMDADDRADLFNALTEDEQEALLPALAQAEREDIRRLAAYEDGTAGAIMTSDYAVLSPDLSARQALDTLRREAPDKETIYRAYVVDADRKLLGSVRLQDLILAPFNKQIEAIMERDTRAVRVDEDQESVARKIARYDVVALPVIDTDGRIVGIVTHDDALDVITEEATEDFHKAGSVGDLAESVGRASILMLYRARVFWLVLLVFGNIFSGAGIAHFEDIIAAHMALLFFLPLLIASGGNAGSQASTLTVRAMATGEVQLGHFRAHAWPGDSGRGAAGPDHGDGHIRDWCMAWRFGHRPGRLAGDGGHCARRLSDRPHPAFRSDPYRSRPRNGKRAVGYVDRRCRRGSDLFRDRANISFLSIRSAMEGKRCMNLGKFMPDSISRPK